MNKGFIAQELGQVRLMESKYLPEGTCIFVSDGEVEDFIDFLNQMERAKTEIQDLKKRVAELEYSILHCKEKHIYE